MDATFHIKKLNLIFSQHKLHLVKTWIFELFGKIKQVWALRNTPFPEISIPPFPFPAFLRYTVTTGLPRVNNRSLFSKNLTLLTIKN